MATHDFPVVLTPALPNYVPEINAIWLTRCRSYSAGHSIHSIHARLAGQDAWEPAEILSVDGHFITFSHDGVVRTCWNHDPYLLQSMALRADTDSPNSTEFCPSQRILRVILKTGAYAVYLSDEEMPGCDFSSDNEEKMLATPIQNS